MGLLSQWILTDTIEIVTTPGKIWHFFIKLEKNYVDWKLDATKTHNINRNEE